MLFTFLNRKDADNCFSSIYFFLSAGRLVAALTRQCTPAVEAWAAAAATWVLVAQDHTISVSRSRTASFMSFHFMKRPGNYITTVSSHFPGDNGF